MPRRIPLEDFFRKPDKAMLRLSPSGKYLAWMERHWLVATGSGPLWFVLTLLVFRVKMSQHCIVQMTY